MNSGVEKPYFDNVGGQIYLRFGFGRSRSRDRDQITDRILAGIRADIAAL